MLCYCILDIVCSAITIHGFLSSDGICPLILWILISMAFILIALFEYFLILLLLRFGNKVRWFIFYAYVALLHFSRFTTMLQPVWNNRVKRPFVLRFLLGATLTHLVSNPALPFICLFRLVRAEKLGKVMTKAKLRPFTQNRFFFKLKINMKI